MCMEDFNIDRQLLSQAYKADATIAPTNVNIPPNPNRVGIRLSCDDNSSGVLAALAVQLISTTAVAGNFPLASVARADGAATPVDLGQRQITLRDVGEMLKGQLQLQGVVGIVYAVEVLLPVTADRPADVTKLPSGRGVYS